MGTYIGLDVSQRVTSVCVVVAAVARMNEECASASREHRARSSHSAVQEKHMPPLTSSTAPVVKLAPREARNAAGQPISSGWPKRFIG